MKKWMTDNFFLRLAIIGIFAILVILLVPQGDTHAQSMTFDWFMKLLIVSSTLNMILYPMRKWKKGAWISLETIKSGLIFEVRCLLVLSLIPMLFYYFGEFGSYIHSLIFFFSPLVYTLVHLGLMHISHPEIFKRRLA